MFDWRKEFGKAAESAAISLAIPVLAFSAYAIALDDHREQTRDELRAPMGIQQTQP